jgi:hypothetical protein
MVEVRPKSFLVVSGEDFDQTGLPYDQLTELESLLVYDLGSSHQGKTVPVEIVSPKLRHFALFGMADLKEMPKELKNLKSFNLCAVPAVEHLKLLDRMPRLQMLMIGPSNNLIKTLPVEKLPHLQFLAAPFDKKADFSFVEKMPHLRTLAITNMTSEHDLAPLAKCSQLKCLALQPAGSKEKVFQSETVKKLEKDRPDLSIVQGEGLCLGSFWLVPMVIVAGMLVWLLRRRRLGMFHG